MKRRDPRIVYGVGCTWWGSILDVSSNGGLPCCPSCGGMLFEMDCKAKWDDQVAAYAKKTKDPGYRALMEWMRGRCFRTMHDAKRVYAAHFPLTSLWWWGAGEPTAELPHKSTPRDGGRK